MSVRVLLAGFPAPALDENAPGIHRGAATTRLLADAATAEQQAGEGGGGVALGVQLTILPLPPSYERAARALRDALDAAPYDHFLLLGTDAASSEHKLHVLAANYSDHPESDADGSTLTDTIIDPDGPVAYRSRLPLDGIWDKFLVERVPVRMSHKADLGLFNHAYYTALHHIDGAGLAIRGGALETPPAPGDEADGTEPRALERLEDDLLMVLSVLAQLHPATRTTVDEEEPEHRAS